MQLARLVLSLNPITRVSKMTGTHLSHNKWSAFIFTLLVKVNCVTTCSMISALLRPFQKQSWRLSIILIVYGHDWRPSMNWVTCKCKRRVDFWRDIMNLIFIDGPWIYALIEARQYTGIDQYFILSMSRRGVNKSLGEEINILMKILTIILMPFWSKNFHQWIDSAIILSLKLIVYGPH